MPNVRPSLCPSRLPARSRSWLALAGLALALVVACRDDSRPTPPVGSSTGGKRTDPDRTGLGGKSGTGGEQMGGGEGGTTTTPPVDAPVSGPDDVGGAPDVIEPEDVGNADAPITCSPECGPGEVCMNGQCSSICTPEQSVCPTGCADLMIDGANCGKCGMACPAGQFCSVGKCVTACKDGETRCGQSCVSLNTNAKNCGQCGKTCATNEACADQVCKCADPNKVCGGTCTKVQNNPNHCGKCNNDCDGDFVCNGSSCGCPGGRRECPNKPGTCVGSLNQCCPSGQLWCGGKCINPDTDGNHCNGCNIKCPGSDICNAGKCVCPAGRKDCGGGSCLAPDACCGGQQKCADGTCKAACPVACVVSNFGEWGMCSKACGTGTRSRSRTIVTQPSGGGAACPPLTESEPCNTQACTVDCAVSGWSAWSACSKECGGGTRMRTRTVTTQPGPGGKPCPDLSEMEACNAQACAVDCVPSEWSDWGACSKECGGGTQTRTRTVMTPASGGGKACDLTDSRPCNTQSCTPPGTGGGSGGPGNGNGNGNGNGGN